MVPAALTVVIAAYNMQDYIAATLDSLAAQDSHAFRVVVVDDGSKDETAEIARRFEGRLTIEVHSIANGGVSRARNFGLECVTTDYVIFLDADDLLRPDAVRLFVEALREHPEWVGCSANHIKFENDPPRPAPHDTPVQFVKRETFVRDLLQRNFIVNGGAICMTTEAARACGGYDTRLKLGEDREFWLRVGLLGPIPHAENFFPLAYRIRTTGANTKLRSQKTLSSLDVMFANPQLSEIITAAELAHLRKDSDAERHWTTVRSFVKTRQAGPALKGIAVGLLRHPRYLRTVVSALKRRRARQRA